MAKALTVWLHTDQVGRLSLHDGRLAFCYDNRWLAHEKASALSFSLPLQVAPFDDAHTRPSAPNILRLLDNVIFNALIGNHDAHGKNFSLLYTSDNITLAPLYDILCTTIYPEFTSKMAMKLGSKYTFHDVFPSHWQQYAQDSGLAWAQTRKRILNMAQTLPNVAKNLLETSFKHELVAKQIVELITQRAALTVQRFEQRHA